MSITVLDNVTVWIGDGSSFFGHLIIRDDRIKEVARGRYTGPITKIVDLAELSISPGFIDLMVLGGFGLNILRDDCRYIAHEYLPLGVTSCQFCCGGLAWEDMSRIQQNVYDLTTSRERDAASVLGLYWEGPFKDSQNAGAGLANGCLEPTADNVRRVLNDLGRSMNMITVSPGIPNDTYAVRKLAEAGKVVTMSHSNAPAERVEACVSAGTSVLGHCWNNHNGALAEAGVQLATLEHVALTDDRITYIHLICDGVHVQPTLIRLVHRCRGVEAICLVTDAVDLAGCSDGNFLTSDGRHFYKKNGVGRTAEHELCGSGLLLPDHWRNYIHYTGITPAEAVRTVTLNPASSINLDREIGLLAPGRLADIVAWDSGLMPQRIWKYGCEISNVSNFSDVRIKDCAKSVK